ncbi:hypothetical protein Dda_6944 [Drechslerella dactyloides]|uniref:Uncharacterized protein n=1 Tax=Drechslerella dactyloides TaxID=74499 RepID=A0AAD6ITD7_DREDA|nr:hypothetical protein Dda_6944 [Drechslerella dactyloides]
MARDQAQLKTKYNSIRTEFYVRLLEIVHWWLTNTHGGRAFIASETAAGRTARNVNRINQDNTARLNWKYWCELNSATISRHIFGQIHDTFIPTFCTSDDTRQYRDNITLLVVHLGGELSKYANTENDLGEEGQAISTDAEIKRFVGRLDYYTVRLPLRYVDDNMPYSLPNTRRATRRLYDFRILHINAIPVNPANGSDDIPPNMTYG